MFRPILSIAAILVLVSQTSIHSQPSARWTHSICYDTQSGAVLLFGGNSQAGFHGDLWSYSKGTWTKLSDSGPAARHKFAFAYDDKRQCAVLFGGADSKENLLGDTWEWDGKIWKKVDAAGPVPRNHPIAAYDRQSKTIILRGGYGQPGLLTDTWSFDGSTWTQFADAGTAGQGLSHGMFIDESTQQLAQITATMGDNQQRVGNSWWTLSKDAWQATGNEFPSTSPQSIQAMASFGKGGILVLDGDDVKDGIPTTWLYSNGKWTGEHIDGPSPRVGHAMVWDPAEEAVILFGGFDRKNFFGDTWMWRDGRWRKL